MSRAFGTDARTFTNPVYPHSFPDPFVLKFRGYFYGYCTGHAEDGRVFGMLRSTDLIDWEPIGGAMEPIDPSPPFYWAPEVTYSNGKFYLYYSVGNETLMELRVAVSDRPDGGFVDSGKVLTSEEFAIDAHVFIDDDGSRYMFYATDFLEHSHIGTGTVMDKMADWFTLAGNARPVTRAKYDWQVYDPQRAEKGGVRWHTVEGPTVLKRKGLYYEMFSGGNWQNTTYGVSFAVTDDLEDPNEWRQYSDGSKILPILRTIPDLIVGPGHNSVVRGPDNRELYCIYHRWTDAGRVLAIDRMDFAGQKIFVSGGTHTPQISPFAPAVVERFEGKNLANWTVTGEWSVENNEARSTGDRACRLSQNIPAEFLAEIYVRSADGSDSPGRFGFTLKNGDSTLSEFALHPGAQNAVLSSIQDGQAAVRGIEISSGTVLEAPQLLRFQVNGRLLLLTMPGTSISLAASLTADPDRIELFSHNASAAFSSFELTEGFEDLFDRGEDPTLRGWTLTGIDDLTVNEMEVVLKTDADAAMTKGAKYTDQEFAVNACLQEGRSGAEFGIAFNGEDGRTFIFGYDADARSLFAETGTGRLTADMPEHVDINEYQQFRIVRLSERVECYLSGVLIFVTKLAAGDLEPTFICRRSRIAVEAVRLTVLRSVNRP